MNDAAAFRKLAQTAQLAQIRGLRVEREFKIERGGIDESNRTAWLSIASDRPYERWWGVEVLDVTPKAIRDERLKSGAALLVGHDPADQVGVIEHHQVTTDGKLRVLARFGKSARAEEIFRDVLDGIRRNTSVGYIIHDLILEKQEGDVNTYRVTDWEPLEGSLVSVPADPSVGVGRSSEAALLSPTYQRTTMENEENGAGTELQAEYQKKVGSTPKAEVADALRVRDLLKAGQEFHTYGGDEVARELIAIPGAGMEQFKARMMERMRTKGGPTITAQPGPEYFRYGEGAREILQAPRHFRGPDAQRNAYASGMWFKAIYGNEAAIRWCNDNGMQIRAMSGSVNSAGGFLVPEAMSGAIIDLMDTFGQFRQNAENYPMKSDTLSIPRSNSDPTAAFVGENGQIGESEGDWGNVNLSAKKVATVVRISTELIEDAIINTADRVAFQLARAFAKVEDGCGFIGDGTSTYGGMRGIFSLLVDGSHGAGKVVAASGHDTFPEIDNTDLGNVIAALPAYAHDGAKWYCSQVAWALVFFRLMAIAGGNRAADMAGDIPKSYGGYPVVVSPVLPAGAATDYSGLTMLSFGNLRLASSFGARRDIRIQILTEKYSDYDQVGIQATERFDIVNHDLGDNTTAGPIVGLIGAA